MSQVFESSREAAQALHKLCDGGPSWAVGITSDPERRLAAVHLIDLDKDDHCWVECQNEQVAWETQDLVFEKFEYRPIKNAHTMREKMVYVYAYRITESTCQGL